MANIILENFGQTTALDLELKFEPPLKSTFESEAVAFFDTPKVLPPRYRVQHLFASWPDYFAREFPKRYDVTVRYRRSDTSESILEHHVVDVAGFEHVHFTSEKGLPDLVGEAAKLRQLLEKYFKERAADDRASATRDELLYHGPSSSEAIRIMRETWSLMQEARKTSYVSTRGFRSALRQLARAAEASSVGDPAKAEFCAAVRNVYIALCHPGFDRLADAKEPEVLVEAALEAAEAALH